jgi:hypothetical protein
VNRTSILSVVLVLLTAGVAASQQARAAPLVYSFEMTVPGNPGVDEVNVDAKTDKVVGVEHESPEHEVKERAKPKPASP